MPLNKEIKQNRSTSRWNRAESRVKLNNTGDNGSPCFTPCPDVLIRVSPIIKFIASKEEVIYVANFIGRPLLRFTWCKTPWETLSNAFLISKNITTSFLCFFQDLFIILCNFKMLYPTPSILLKPTWSGWLEIEFSILLARIR